MEIAKGIHWLKVPIPDNPLENVNSYLIMGDEKHTLVDPGWPDLVAFQSLKDQLGEIGMTLDDIDTLIATHGHPDHMGLAGEIRRLNGAKLLMHESVFTRQSVEFGSTQFAENMRNWLLTNGIPAEKLSHLGGHGPSSFKDGIDWRVMPDQGLKDGENLDIGGKRFKVIWTPGHSPDHICLYQAATKTLLSGDHILPVITPSISLTPWNSSIEDPLGTFVQSLKKLTPLDVDLVLPAHEQPIQHFQKRVDELFVHHDERLAELVASLGDGETSAYDIAAQMHWVGLDGVVKGEDLPPSQQPLAMGETLAHLELLIRDGRVKQRMQNGVKLFSAKPG
jgi:glyoxylase-like metal-dependent hydrolase (beta-lactamase superfamily II)